VSLPSGSSGQRLIAGKELMRRLRYCVAASLDGFIAGPRGEYDWIVQDPSFDFAALWEQFDTLLMGRLTYEVAIARLTFLTSMGKKLVVASTTLAPSQHPGVTVIASNLVEAVTALKAQPGKEIWLMGGGSLFRGLLDAGLVDSVELSVIPVLLGSGVSLVPAGSLRRLHLDESKALPTGILTLKYTVVSELSGR
jgi:dihydrofolate reductase